MYNLRTITTLLTLAIAGTMSKNIDAYIGHTHRVKNNSKTQIHVRLEYHGKSALGGKDHNLDLQPGEEHLFHSAGYQLRKITVTAKTPDGKEQKMSMNVKNASGKLAAAIVTGTVVAVPLFAGTLLMGPEGILLGATGAPALAATAAGAAYGSVPLEHVAYASTSWEVATDRNGTNYLTPKAGVTTYD